MIFLNDDANGLKVPKSPGRDSPRVKASSVPAPDPISTLPSVPGMLALRAYASGNTSNIVEPLVLARQIMSSPVRTIRKDISLFEAWREMRKGDVQQLVVTAPRRKVIGVVSERDILRYMNISRDGVEMNRIMPVADILSTDIVTADISCDIRKIALAMVRHRMEAMPVVNQDELVGIITRGDILRGFAEYPKLNLWA